MKSYVIHLIRHGMCSGNEEGRYTGSTDSPLSENGKSSIEMLKKECGYPKAQEYYCSPLLRCRETMSVIYPDAKPVIIDGFKETNFGKWEGKTAEELKKEDPLFEKWISGDTGISPPDGESGMEFMHRVCKTFEEFVEKLMKSGTTSAVLITHGGVIMTILAAYGLPRAKFYEWVTDFGCGYSLRITPGLWMRDNVVEVFDIVPKEHEDSMTEVRKAADMIWGENEENQD